MLEHFSKMVKTGKFSKIDTSVSSNGTWLRLNVIGPGQSFGLLWATLGTLGPPWDTLGPPWASLGHLLGLLWASLGLFGRFGMILVLILLNLPEN